MVKTLEQYKQEVEILKRAKEGRRKEQIKNIKSKIKKAGVAVSSYKIKKKPSKFKKIAGVVNYRPSLSSNLMRTYGGMGGTRQSGSQQRVKEGPGRPRGDYKHRDPQTGQRIPATLFYKRMKEVKRQAEQLARLRDIQAVQEMSKRGIPPSQAKQIVDARQLQSVGVQPQIQQVQMQPQRIPTQITPEMQRQLFIQQLQRQQPQQQGVPSQTVRPIWRRQNTQRYERDIFGDVKVVQGGNDPKNFWN